VTFVEGDAAEADLPSDVDLLHSRFGTMFFAEPVAAFVHLRSALRPGGRAVFVCWRTPRDNAWAMTPLLAARTALGVEAQPMDPHAPGPFAFADEARVKRILEDSGFIDVALARADVSLRLGSSPHEAARAALRVGPVARLLRELGPGHEPRAFAAIEAAFAEHTGPDGAVRLPGSGWIVQARNAA